MATWGGRRRLIATVVLATMGAACAERAADVPSAASPTTIPEAEAGRAMEVPSATTVVFAAPPTSSPAATATPTTTATFTTDGEPQFTSRVSTIDTALAGRMRSSWHAGCPVDLAGLRYVTLSYWGYDGAPHDGELVVAAAHAESVVDAFAELFAARFPIERMQLVDDYGGDDAASMRANNTSAFNCPDVDGRPGVRSMHSWGTAIDINPLVNPWVRGTEVDPPEGAPYADRRTPVQGGVYPRGVVVEAFARIGWGWGGDWSTSQDLQHFSATGN